MDVFSGGFPFVVQWAPRIDPLPTDQGEGKHPQTLRTGLCLKSYRVSRCGTLKAHWNLSQYSDHPSFQRLLCPVGPACGGCVACTRAQTSFGHNASGRGLRAFRRGKRVGVSICMGKKKRSISHSSISSQQQSVLL